MQVGVEVVGDKEVAVHEVASVLVNDEFLVETVAVAGLVVGLVMFSMVTDLLP